MIPAHVLANAGVDGERELDGCCAVCFQPECSESTGGYRPESGVLPFRPQPGRSVYMGYGDWALHPEEASIVLHRGYAIVNGNKRPVVFQFNYAHCAIVRVDGTNSDLKAERWDMAA